MCPVVGDRGPTGQAGEGWVRGQEKSNHTWLFKAAALKTTPHKGWRELSVGFVLFVNEENNGEEWVEVCSVQQL